MGSASSKAANPPPLKEKRPSKLPKVNTIEAKKAKLNDDTRLNSVKLRKEPPQNLKLDVNLNSERNLEPLREVQAPKKDVQTVGQEIESEDSEYELEDVISPPRTLTKDKKSTSKNRDNLASSVTEQNGHSEWTEVKQVSEKQYPESYAKKTLREQYTQNPILRQKTIYRDPDEWEIEEENEDTRGFDPLKFKKANKSESLDIFKTDKGSTAGKNTTNELEFYYDTPKKPEKAIPKYDVTEEQLMADIEKEFGDIL